MSTPHSAQQAWAAGDFSKIGASGVIVGELLCDAIRLHANERVLDVATGAGNTALAAARRSTDVVGVDFVPALLERARERAHAERLQRLRFELAENTALPFLNGSFDVVLSTFGHMFSPDPAQVTAEMVRVCRPGGRIGFAAWTPQGFNGGMFRTNAKYNPPPAGVPAPVLWGEESGVRERFAPYADEFRFERRFLTFRAPTAGDWLAYMREHFGPTRVLWEKLDGPQREAHTREMLELLAQFNQSGDATLFVPAEYLETVIVLR
jgi:ubiquinone/menaquinone biosynthesis C-methylase UbiE